MNVSQLISHLNAIEVGEIDAIRAKLEEARTACLALRQELLADQLGEAEQALCAGDLQRYRKRVATVISRLGHVR